MQLVVEIKSNECIQMGRVEMIRISDKNRREMSAERDFSVQTPVKIRYCILSSPRSGSTLLGRMLFETKKAGDPQEYFNPPLLEVEREISGISGMNLNEFMQRMEKRRTSPNGVFGMKLHYSQMLGAFNSNRPNKAMLGFLGQFGRLIWIRRRDRLGQAISQAIAMHTQVWSSEDSKFGKTDGIDIHPFECVQALRMVAGDDYGWEQLIKAAGLKVYEVWYEDLVANYEFESRKIFKHLGLELQVEHIPPPPLERQSGELNQRIRKEFTAYLAMDKI